MPPTPPHPLSSTYKRCPNRHAVPRDKKCPWRRPAGRDPRLAFVPHSKSRTPPCAAITLWPEPKTRAFGRVPFRHLTAMALAAALAMALPIGAGAAPASAGRAAQAAGAPQAGIRIVAVVNGDVISNVDVDDRARLFALSTGQPLTPEVLDRLRPQIRRQLVDELLELQEIQRRHIVIQDQQIAEAIRSIESRNNMPAGTLRQKLAADGIGLRTLVDQIRTQLGWLQVVRQQLGTQAEVAPAAIAERQRMLERLTGRPEYQVAEIFIPIDDPAAAGDAQRFADTVITELRAGAPFPTVAAQFSASQSALEGGALGWIQPNQLDPEVARIVAEMPVGAVSNPIKVPGGLMVVTMQGKRDIGKDMGTVARLRQLFLPFTSTLNPQAPTEQQRQTLEKAHAISASVHGCDQMEAAAKNNASPRPLDPGEVRLDRVNPPAFRQMLQSISIGQASQPLVSADGITVLVVCSREEKNMAAGNDSDLRAQIVEERAELAARQLQRTLRRQATIELRPSGA
jgi:peptidyl-prolyl cis-trans isomerase SurA